MRRTLFAAPIVAVCGLATLVAFRSPSTAGPAPSSNGPVAGAKPPAALPLTHVVLFSSGVGYFQREGEVDGNVRIDLTFPATDVNDLIKSLVLQDTGGGKVSAINYDSQDPVERTLRTFALDLTANPSLGQLLNMARGEKVEVTLAAGANGQSGTLSGAILGMESQKQPHGKEQTIDVDVLNLVSAEGLRSVPLAQVLRVRFLNATVEAELRRALDVIAGARDAQKKSVGLSFRGDGKRGVRVGYVVESPVWKTSYRLILNGDGKASLQGWGVVENTTDDDWTNVKMALVSGRPISYQMDLYPPLYVPRPTVELEKFASLRPPTYGGAMTNPQQPMAGGVGIGGFGGGGIQGGIGGNASNTAVMQNGVNFNRFQGQWGNLGGQLGNQGGQGGNQMLANNDVNNLANNGRLTFEQLQQRRAELSNNKALARRAGGKIAGIDPTEGVASVASAEEIGDVCQYVIDEKVTLPRLKSAMLPIVDQKVSASKLSIFNESVHAKFPLLGVRFKNDAKEPLMQGPVTVYEGQGYSGDARFPDLQPGEERLVSYALDLGTEVKTEGGTSTQRLDAVKAVKGVMISTHKLRHGKRYLIKNRAGQERTLVVEHPVREGWELVPPLKPAERSRDVYRFILKVPAGAAHTFEVVEELRRVDSIELAKADHDGLKVILRSSVASPKMKEALERVIALHGKWTDAQRELSEVQAQLKAITDDQTRLRANFEKMPPTSDAYKRYLAKFDSQETEIEKLQADVKIRFATEKARKSEYEAYLMNLTIDG